MKVSTSHTRVFILKVFIVHSQLKKLQIEARIPITFQQLIRSVCRFAYTSLYRVSSTNNSKASFSSLFPLLSVFTCFSGWRLFLLHTAARYRLEQPDTTQEQRNKTRLGNSYGTLSNFLLNYFLHCYFPRLPPPQKKKFKLRSYCI